MTASFTTREQVVEVISRLFIYTDNRQWDLLQSEVFAANVLLDMVSLGAEKAETLASAQICDMWEKGFADLDAIHHQAGTYAVNFTDDGAIATAYAVATHYKESATAGKTREFVGSYDFHLIQTDNGWRIDRFTYHLKYTGGNLELT